MTTARARKRAPELMLRRPLSLGRKTACLLGGNAFLGRARVAALGDARRLAGTAAQVIELGATHRALADHFDLVDVRRLDRLDEVHLIRPSYVAARQRETGPEHPHGAPKGPASVTVYLPRPALYARPRSSHDPPIAALRGSCALPTLEVG